MGKWETRAEGAVGVFHFSISSKELVGAFIDAADLEAVKVNGPDGIVGRFECEVVTGEHLTDANESVSPADLTSCRDFPDLEVGFVFGLG